MFTKIKKKRLDIEDDNRETTEHMRLKIWELVTSVSASSWAHHKIEIVSNKRLQMQTNLSISQSMHKLKVMNGELTNMYSTVLRTSILARITGVLTRQRVSIWHLTCLLSIAFRKLWCKVKKKCAYYAPDMRWLINRFITGIM